MLDKFPVRQGVIQGDLTSLIYFIIALDAMLRRHDTTVVSVRPIILASMSSIGWCGEQKHGQQVGLQIDV